MIKRIELAKKIDEMLRKACMEMDDSAALVREQSPEETEEYVSAIGHVFMCMYEKVFDPLYKEHPQLAPPSWEPSGKDGGSSDQASLPS